VAVYVVKRKEKEQKLKLYAIEEEGMVLSCEPQLNIKLSPQL
jgi:hypothetical protein